MVKIFGNWKMHKTLGQAQEFVEKLLEHEQLLGPDVGLAVPFTCIAPLAHLAKARLQIGAQNIHDCSHGAFTGEIAAKMVLDAGATFALIGHSERRHRFGESDAFVAKKMERALEDGLTAVLCVGETLEERQAQRQDEVILAMLDTALEHVVASQLEHVLIAYEPVWAIGTGETATPQIANAAHATVVSFLEQKYGAQIASKISILYGGSVTPVNCQELINQPHIHGLLIGGASLQLESFLEILQNCRKVRSSHE